MSTLVHHLKIQTEFFEAVNKGLKKFEIRRNDRDFKIGDWVFLENFNPKTNSYEPGIIKVEIIYIIEGGQFGIEEGFIIFGFNKI